MFARLAISPRRIRMIAPTNTGISLVIPAFNEAAVISRAIAEAETALSRHFRSV